jgi:hypothetical protein
MDKMLKIFLFILIMPLEILYAQNSSDSLKKELQANNADDPSQFLTRIEIFNELQRYNKRDAYVNQAILRTIVKIGNKFTTRLDLPYVHNSITSPSGFKQSGIGDISFRLLGYKLFESRRSVFTSSIEVSMNTAASPLLGTGKNVLLPVISYSRLIPAKKILLAAVFQQAKSISGDKFRADISFSKLQLFFLKYFSRKTWMVLQPEWFLDYMNGGLSMNFRSRLTHAPLPRINIWLTPSAGIFGDFVGRYDWSVDMGGRYFLFRK